MDTTGWGRDKALEKKTDAHTKADMTQMQMGSNPNRTACRTRSRHSCATVAAGSARLAACGQGGLQVKDFGAVVLYGRQNRWALSTQSHSATPKSVARRQTRTTGHCGVQGTASCTPP